MARLRYRGIAVTAVTKAILGAPEIAEIWQQAGVSGLGDSRIENVRAMRAAGIPTLMTLVRSPMLSQAEQVVCLADVSLNTELEVIRELSSVAKRLGRTHAVVLMVELGDLREGIMPALLEQTVREVLQFPNITFKGIGANLACRSGVSPDIVNMTALSSFADDIDSAFGPVVEVVSGGNSASLSWALSGVDTGRINDLRLGESLLLGVDPLQREPIPGLHTDAIRLVTEVIESKRKPSQPWGKIAQAAFGEVPSVSDRGDIVQSILAVGRQDIDPEGLIPPPGIEILGASSDHLVVESTGSGELLTVGGEISFQINYSALLRAMTSPFITKVMSPLKAVLREEIGENFRA